MPKDTSFVNKELTFSESTKVNLLKEDSEGWLSLDKHTPLESDTQFLLKADNFIGKDLTSLQKIAVQKLLLQNKELFGENKGLTSLILHTIENSSIIFSKNTVLKLSINLARKTQ